jgi:hypothetical protein
MKPKEENLEKNISRLVKLAGDSNQPNKAFTDSMMKDALDELKGTKAEQEGNDKFVKVKWKRTLPWAAVVLVVCGIGFGILISNANKTGKKAESDIKMTRLPEQSSETAVQDKGKPGGAELVVKETAPHNEFVADEAYESLKVSKNLDAFLKHGEPNYNMLLAARAARAAKPVDMVKPKPVPKKLLQEPERTVRVRASEALTKLAVEEDAVARKKIKKDAEQVVESDKPIAHWAFEEGRGSKAYDWAGNNHGTIHGATWTTGRVGRALSFDGEDDYVQVADDDSLSPGSVVTLDAWIKPASIPIYDRMMVAGKWNDAPTEAEYAEYEIQIWDGKVCFYAYGADTGYKWAESSTTLVAGNWYYVAGVFDGSTLQVYINGSPDGPLTAFAPAAGIPNNKGRFTIGAQYWDYNSDGVMDQARQFHGLIDEVAIYDRALSAKGIRRLYQQRTSGLVAHWKFDEGSGTVAHDSIGNNHGTVHGAKWTIGRVGGALSFDGVDDYVDCGNDPLFDITGPITLMAWVKTSSGSSVWQGIVTKGEVLWKIQKHVGGNGDFECWGLIGAPRPGPYLSTVGVNMNDGQWHHIAGTYDGAAMRIYWDGTLNSSLSVSGTINTGSDRVYIGGVYGKPKYGFSGVIDEVTIYNRALSAEEIRQLYKYGSPDKVKQPLRKPAEPLAWLVTMTPLGVMFGFRPPAGSSGWTDMELYEHGGEMLAEFSCPHIGEPIQVWLAEPVDQNDPAKYYLRYRIRVTAAPLPKWGVIGLSRMPMTTNKTSDKNTPSTPVPAKDMGVNIAMSHGPVKDGLAAFLICEQNQFKLDEPVPLLYGIVYNGPDESMAVPAPNPAVDPSNRSWFSITGPDGNDVPYMGVYATFPRLSPKDVLRLKRRNFHGRLTPNVRDYFKLCTPGIYTIKWHYQIGSIVGDFCWVGHLVSNEIKIEIVK